MTSNMVVQANTKANLWGWDTPGKTVSVSVSWSSDRYEAKVGKDGRWLVSVTTPEASYTPLKITFSDGDDTIALDDVLAGQVWVCGGQSNMEMPVRGFDNCPVEGFNQTIAEAANTASVRFAKVKSMQSMKPLDDAQVEWRKCDPNNVADASATGYYFARMLHKVLNQPIGIIEANQGGTAVEGWLNRDNLKKYTDETLDSASIYAKYFMARQLVWGNGTFNPILNYTVKGIIFYQGCANVARSPQTYASRLALLVDQWRKDLRGGEEMPFYFVEIAPYSYGNCAGTDAAYLRSQQFAATKLIPNSGMVSTNDAVYPDETEQIHPRQKQKVGERLAFYALGQTYGVKGFTYKSPSYKSMEVKDGKAYIHLADAYNTVCPLSGIKGFEVAGADKTFHKAEAWAENNQIVVKCDEVAEPVAVRYCWHNFELGNVTNQGNLPLIPFRTDNW